MVEVKTAEGVIQCPELDQIGPRTKFWASAIRDVIRTEEMYHVMGAALEEAYNAGRICALKELMFNLGKMEEVVDAEFSVVEGDSKVVRDEGELEGVPEVGEGSQGPDAEAEGPAPAGPIPPGPAEASSVGANSGGGV